jgi:hypothetical protein
MSSHQVLWQMQAVAIGDAEPIAAGFGTAQSSLDNGGQPDYQYIGPESAAIAVGGTPQSEDVVYFRVSRLASDGDDTLPVDARLIGITVYINTVSGNDE